PYAASQPARAAWLTTICPLRLRSLWTAVDQRARPWPCGVAPPSASTAVIVMTAYGMGRRRRVGEGRVPTRQDQLHSYQFTMQRVVAALVMHDTDPPQSPSRRIAGATLAGALVAALALGAVAAYGMLSGRGDPGWRDGGAVVVERESGARLVYRDGRLYPVANHTSPLLFIGSAAAKTVHVPRASLGDVPCGTPPGIADAPDPLPAGGRLVGAPWTLCSGLSADGQGGARAEAVLFVGADPGGG